MTARSIRSCLTAVAAALCAHVLGPLALGTLAFAGHANAASSDARPSDAGATGGRGALVVFAAASLTEVLDEVDHAFTAASGIEVKVSFAASSALARQIENGAAADIYFSADEEWMDYLAQRKLIRAATRQDVAGNRLVLIAPAASGAKVDVRPGFSVLGILGADGRLAAADPDSVPAGKYAKAALMKLGAWRATEPRLVRAENVRTALAYVARGEAPLGVVYSTDAKAEKRVKVVGVFPADAHAPIRYPVAATHLAGPKSRTYLQFVRGNEARGIFLKYGFEPVR